MHVRQSIRKAIVATLGAGTAYPVRESLTRSTSAQELPALHVYTNADALFNRDAIGQDRTKETRRIAVTVEARAVDSNDVQDVIDDMSEQAQAALYADPTLGGLVRDLWLEEFSLLLIDEVEAPYAAASATYQAEYRIDGTDPGAIIG